MPEQSQAARPGLSEPRATRTSGCPPAAGAHDWTGDADRGTDWRQPGGWIYNILPYIEQQALYQMGAGLPGPADQASSPKCKAELQRIQIPLGILYCPTRRPAICYPYYYQQFGIINAGTPKTMARNDYAGNGGDVVAEAGETFTAAWQHAPPNPDCGPLNIAQIEDSYGNMTAVARTTFTNAATLTTGIFYAGSMLTMADITDAPATRTSSARSTSARTIMRPVWTGATTKWRSAASSTTLSAGP